MVIKDKLLDLLEISDRKGAVKLVMDYADANGFPQAISDLLEPALIGLGNSWAKGTITLAHGFMAAKVAEDILKDYHASVETHPKKKECKVIMGNIEDDFHVLGRKMVTIFLRASGWEVLDLGCDISASEFIDTALQQNAKIIGISAMMHTTALNIKKVREELDKNNLSKKIKLAVGGAIFNLRPELVQEVGGDGTAKNAVEAPELFDNLYLEVANE